MGTATVAWVLCEIIRSFAWESHQAPGQMVFQNKGEMARVWVTDGGKEDRMPKVDFEKETVIAIFAGPKNGTGHRVRIEAVIQTEDQKEGIVLHKTFLPGEGERASQMTYPNHVVVIRKSTAPFRFVAAESEEGKKLLESMKGGKK
jgi:hypothetical protein